MVQPRTYEYASVECERVSASTTGVKVSALADDIVEVSKF